MCIRDRVKVARSNGVAWQFIGHPIERSEPVFVADCIQRVLEDTGEPIDETHECDDSCGYWDYEDMIRDDQAIVCMVGDDRWSTYDIAELTALPREEYCGECGQIGCQCDGYDREDT